jgi:hypothetical protein
MKFDPFSLNCGRPKWRMEHKVKLLIEIEITAFMDVPLSQTGLNPTGSLSHFRNERKQNFQKKLNGHTRLLQSVPPIS